MTLPKEDVATQPLTLTQDLILMLLNEESGYFHQVPGWDLNCAVVSAVLAELSLRSRIDTDQESLFLVDQTETSNSVLHLILKEIASEPVQRNAQYWIERLAPRAELIIDLTLDRLVDLKVLEHHDGEFWTLSRTAWQTGMFSDSPEGTAVQFVKTRISNAIFNKEIPDPRDAIIICLINTCDVFRFMFQLDDESEQRIQFVCKMDLIGRSIAAAVSHNLAGPLLRRSALTKKIPTVSLRKLLLIHTFAKATSLLSLPTLQKSMARCFRSAPPCQTHDIPGRPGDKPMGASARAHVPEGQGHYFADFEKVYGAAGVLPALDGADHFRLRKSLSAAYSRKRLAEQLDELYDRARKYMANWKVGDSYPATGMSRRMINAQISPLMVGVETQDIIDDLLKFKEWALSVHIMKVLPKFMLKNPGMRRRAKNIATLLERIQSVHTPAQRAGAHRNSVDDYLSLHASDPQFVPESNLRFAFTAALVASAYLGDAFSFALYAWRHSRRYTPKYKLKPTLYLTEATQMARTSPLPQSTSRTDS